MTQNSDFLTNLLQLAHGTGATDLHICPGSKPLVRVGGTLDELDGEPVISPRIISEITDTLLDEKRKQRLEIARTLDFSFSRSGLGRFRANIYSQRGTFAMAIRLLPFEIPQFGTLGLPGSVQDFTTYTHGMFLATGATGSGKSTTLASLLDLINEKYRYHIITIEDPIEYLHRHKKSLVTQRELGEDTPTFSAALHSALREDPDVIMVGEMRDPETISIALTAAETGHIVFSTLHTVGVAKSIDRIVDAFPSDQHTQIRSQLATVLGGVVSQQLVPRADKSGLTIASEVMLATPAIRNLIREGKHYQINSTMQTSQNAGMHLLEANLAELFKNGIITHDDMVHHAQDQQLLQLFLNRK